ncbi:MAG: ABC transporter ATP-binding protein [Chloroflexi bacterium]|nr:ABC transporter ATP-binding protein [Chloroflexota bacterium]
MSDGQYEELQEVDKRPFDYGLLKRMLRYTRPYRKELTLATVVIAIGSVLRLAEPYLLRTAIDLGITPGNMQVVNRVAGIWLAFQIIGAITEYIRIHILNRTGQNLLYDMRQELFDHLQWLSLRFYDARPVGRIMARVTNDVETINDLINSGLVTIIAQSISLVGIVVVMFVINVRLAMMAFVVLPLMVFAIARLRPAIETGWRNVRKANSNINANLNESITGIRVTQAFGREGENVRRFQLLNNAYFGAFMSAIRAEVLIWPLVDLLGITGSALVLWYGARLVLADELTIGYVLAFTDYLFRFWEPINAISRVYSRVLSAMASAERIFEYLDTQPEIVDIPDAEPLRGISGRVEFENVSFRYKDDDRWVLQNINFTIEPGQTVALVGPTGAGKTSIINLLMRFYDPQEGRVLVDGYDIARVQLPTLRDQLALVLQESFLFSGSIADNIRYSRLDATMEEVERAAAAVHADGFISRYEDGYEHEVGERGASISVGQRQLLSFARALLANPRILILDEATSSVDSQTERAIQDGMRQLLEGRTTFIIAHRLSTIQRADCIMVIENGRIVETGTHDELLILPEGHYAHLYARQFAVWEAGRLAACDDADHPAEGATS